MISEFLMNIVFGIVEGALSILPGWEWNVNASFFQSFLDMIRLAGYLLPMDTIVTIIVIINLLLLFRIAISIIKTIWELLPLV